ncbi:hypothetical protein CI109_100379 [Kwoniella shandongensis]|uniref:Trehalase n=1 Tax=Kwoniella shandongensis TaxID=1734106 RepID=A0AAJ8MTW9_9TREE
MSVRANDPIPHHFRPRPTQILLPVQPLGPHPLEASLHPRSPDELRAEWAPPLPWFNSPRIVPVTVDNNIDTTLRPHISRRSLTLPTMAAQATQKATITMSLPPPPLPRPQPPPTKFPTPWLPLVLPHPLPSATNGASSPPLGGNTVRRGKIGHVETKLPDVHAEAHEYYGGAEVWTRARTFSNVSFTSVMFAYDRLVSLVRPNDALWRWAARPFQGTDAFLMGTYMLSNLLQELALARDFGRKRIVLDEARLAENPVDRLSRMIKNSFWNALTRAIDAEGLEVACADPKNRSQYARSRIYVPYGQDEMAEHYRQILKAIPFVVPGARFNEKYGWDSYLARSQPPFLTDFALQIYNQLDRSKAEENKTWLKRTIRAAIKEYHLYWMVQPSLDPVSGLSRYRPIGLGIPPETEASHFTHILQPYAQRMGISVNEYIDGYNDRSILEPELDEYFMHDRGVRESGHDTSYRLDRKCADLGTYEFDIASAIQVAFDDELEMDEEFELSPWPITPEAFEAGAPRKLSTNAPMTSKHWFERAAKRKEIMDELLWNDGHGMYFDYDCKAQKQTRYDRQALPKFEVAGGLVSGTEESRGIISIDRPNRQWDYPYGWPPHQIMAWVGLERYGFVDDAARLAYRWIYIGNQGTDFQYVPREGFGWMNARRRRAEREARDAEAAASGHGGQPKIDFHNDPPSLEQTIAQLKLEHGGQQ